MPLSDQKRPTTTSELSAADKQALLDLARQSIGHGLETGRALEIDSGRYSATLRAHRASFVTLRIRGELRGCIGSIEPVRSLAVDVAENAFGAAFRDPRFEPLNLGEYPRLEYHVSVLSPFEELQFRDMADLLAQMTVGADGFVLEWRKQRGLLLPSVWGDLTRPEEFLHHLKIKAGLPPDFWADDLRIFRFTSESFGEND